jgi:hypothetical protein
MNEPDLKKPTKKTFHFPKSATAEATADAQQGDAAVEVAAAKPEKTKTATTPKASRRKSAEKAVAAPKAEAVAKEKSAAKAEAVAKEKAAPKQKAAPKAKAAPKEKAAGASVAATEKPKRAKKEPAKKEPAKKEPAKKESAKKEVAKKEVAKKEPAKKEVAKKEVAKKEKVVRDSFTMPKSDYAKIAALKQKCLDAGISVKKSEILRAGLLLLEGATSQRLLAAISAVEAVKTGRPSKS